MNRRDVEHVVKTRGVSSPLVRYIDQTLAVWIKRKYKRFHRRLGQAREFLHEDRARKPTAVRALAAWRKRRADLMGAG